MAPGGFSFMPSPDKVVKWTGVIVEALRVKKLSAGVASKLASRLMWGCTRMFRRLGRAMLRPLFDQKSRIDGAMSPELERALLWWLKILESGICETHAWRQLDTKPVQLFCDAAGHPAHLGAVLFMDGQCGWTHMAVDQHVRESFRMQQRQDNQIMGLELLAISLGFCTFSDKLKGRRVVVHSDNTGSEVRVCAPSLIKHCLRVVTFLARHA